MTIKVEIIFRVSNVILLLFKSLISLLPQLLSLFVFACGHPIKFACGHPIKFKTTPWFLCSQLLWNKRSEYLKLNLDINYIELPRWRLQIYENVNEKLTLNWPFDEICCWWWQMHLILRRKFSRWLLCNVHFHFMDNY